MTTLYYQQITDLTNWLKVRLPALGPFSPTPHQRIIGLDVFPEPFKKLQQEAFELWLSEREYELSYSQVCNAFFLALEDSEKAVHQ
jgi:hypothetical protein